MIIPRVLAKFGTTNDCFKDLFTAKPGDKLHDLRKAWEDRIESRAREGITHGLKNYQFYAAADLAWDSNIITKELVPLQLYAQGRINFKALTEQLKDVDTDTLKTFADVEETRNGREIKNIKLGKFHEVFVNVVRSFITRRTAALSIKYTQLFPFYKYDPVSTSYVAKLRGDVLSQRIEMIVNQYGYRHDLPQAVRDMLLYGHVLEFAQGAWDVEKQIFPKERADGFDTSNDTNFEVETKTVREGQLFIRPHPTRTFSDNAHPKASFNTDTGCTFAGYWNVVRFREVDKNPCYFNRSEIAFSDSLFGLMSQYRGYWELYYSTAAVNFPGSRSDHDVAGENDRTKNIGVYTPEMGDQSLALIEYRERVIPKEVGLGDYPYPVWVRLVVANGRTVVFGEILPSIPCTYWGFNEDDGRLINNAWAHDIMPWGDQLSNMLTQLLLIQKASLIKVIALNVDLLTEDQVKQFRRIVTGNELCVGPTLVEFRGALLRDMDLDVDDVVKLNEASMLQDVTVFFRSILQLLSLAERVLGVSAQELGQSAPREISATEVAEISNTTNTSLSFMGLGVDEAIDAKKRMLYEAFIAFGQDRIYIPAVNRYTQKTVEAAGFKVEPEGVEEPQSNYGDEARRVTVVGTKNALIYDYNFTSRDGSERASNAKAAEVLVNLLSQLLNIPGVLQDMGKEKLYEFLNTVVRLSGAGVDLTFDMKEGERETLPTGDDAQDNKTAIQDAIRQITDAIGQDRQKMAQLEQMVAGMSSGLAPTTAAPLPLATAA